MRAGGERSVEHITVSHMVNNTRSRLACPLLGRSARCVYPRAHARRGQRHRSRRTGTRLQGWRARRGRHRPRGVPRRDLRLPRAKRSRQVDDRDDAHHAAAADRGRRAGRRPGRGPRGRRGAAGDRGIAAGVSAGPLPDRDRAHAPAERRCTGSARRSASGADDGCSSASAWPRPPSARWGPTPAA